MEFIRWLNRKIPHYSQPVEREFVFQNDPDKFNWLAWTKLLILTFLIVIVPGVAFSNNKCYKIHLGQGTVSTRVNGVVDTSNVSIADLKMQNPELYRKIWTPDDYTFPATQRHIKDLSIMTNIYIIPNQTMGFCPGGNPHKLTCLNDSECDPKNISQRHDGGVLTGKCVPLDKTLSNSTKRCQIHGYCPPYSHTAKLPFNESRSLLEDADTDVVIVIISSMQFPQSKKHGYFWNIKEGPEKKARYFDDCYYDPIKSPKCPKFKLGDIVRGSGNDFKEVAIRGARIKINIKYECSFPMEISSWFGAWELTLGGGPNCDISYSFKRMDQPGLFLAPGWYYDCPSSIGNNWRDFRECFGINIELEVEGTARQLTMSAILIDTLLSSYSLFFLPGAIIELIILKFFVDKNTLEVRKFVTEHPKLQTHFCTSCRCGKLNMQEEGDQLGERDLLIERHRRNLSI